MPVDVMQLDPEQLYEQVISNMEQSLGEILNPGDERRIVAGNILAVLLAAASQANYYARSQQLRYAEGAMLDALGDFVGAERLPAAYARVTMRFTIVAPASTEVTIPKGTRVTADGERFFETAAGITLASDTPTYDIDAVATVAGAGHNGYPAGSINVIVDPVVFVTACENIATSAGGSDAEADDDYRERIRLAPGHFSVAGPKSAYEYWARSADAGIGDVDVSSPAPTEVVVTVLMQDGSLPAQDVLDIVAATLSADTVRPLTDKVTVSAPTEVPYTVAATYYISSANMMQEATIKAACEAAYQNYLVWQSAALGRAINPDELRRLLLNAGATRVDLSLPAYTVIGTAQVARAAEDSELTYGGLT